VPLALGVLSRPVELLHRLAHQHVASLGNGLLMLLGRQPQCRVLLDAGKPAIHGRQPLRDRAKRRRVIRRPATYSNLIAATVPI
jgi:hypothetical protein